MSEYKAVALLSCLSKGTQSFCEKNKKEIAGWCNPKALYCANLKKIGEINQFDDGAGSDIILIEHIQDNLILVAQRSLFFTLFDMEKQEIVKKLEIPSELLDDELNWNGTGCSAYTKNGELFIIITTTSKFYFVIDFKND